jgi:hypothetical protein
MVSSILSTFRNRHSDLQKGVHMHAEHLFTFMACVASITAILPHFLPTSHSLTASVYNLLTAV